MKLSFLARNLWYLMVLGEIHFQFDRIPLVARNVTGAKRRNLFRIALNRLLPVSRAIGRPYMAHISPAGLCDLACTNCPTRDKTIRGRQLLSYDTFRKFIDEAGDTLLYVILWSWGEPTLNPDLPKMTRYAKEKGILTVSSTNLNRLTPAYARDLATSGMDALIIAADGATAESYLKYRKGGDFERLKDNIRLLVKAKKEAGVETPLLNLRMVVSKDNEHQVEDFREMGRSLGVDMISFKAFSTRQSGRENPAIDRRFAPKTKAFRWYRYRDEFHTDKRLKQYRCRFPWTKPTLFADGMVISCEFDMKYEAPFGNINEQSFDEIWFGDKARRFRKAFQKNRDQFDFCRDCVYDYTTFEGCVLDTEMLNDRE